MKMKKMLFLVIIMGITLVSCEPKKVEQKAAEMPPPPPPVAVVDTLCFELVFNKVDITTVQMTVKGDSVTGEMHWHPHEKDGSHGTLKGIKKGNTITADYDYMIEGSSQIEEVIFILEGDKLIQMTGELVEKGNKMVLKDPSKAKKDEVFSKANCSKMLKDTE